MKILFLTLLFVVSACSSRTKVSNPFYYELTKDDKVIHVLGTMHVNFELDDFHPKVREDLGHADLVALEADEEYLKDYSKVYAEAFRDYAWTHYGERFPLKQKLTADAWRNLQHTLSVSEVKRILERWRIYVSPLELNPHVVREIIGDLINRGQDYAFPEIVFEKSKSLDRRWMAHDRSNALDEEILKYGRQLKKKVVHLDNLLELSYFSKNYFDKTGIIFIEELYGTGPSQAKIYTEMREAYKTGDERKIYQLLSDNESDAKGLRLKQRNNTWAEKLVWFPEKRIFVAVGALHLVGKDNILELMQKRGYTVNKIQLRKSKE